MFWWQLARSSSCQEMFLDIYKWHPSPLCVASRFSKSNAATTKSSILFPFTWLRKCSAMTEVYIICEIQCLGRRDVATEGRDERVCNMLCNPYMLVPLFSLFVCSCLIVILPSWHCLCLSCRPFVCFRRAWWVRACVRVIVLVAVHALITW